MTPSISVQRNTRSSSDLCIPQLRVRSRSWVLLAVVFTMVFVCGEILAQTSDAPIDDSTVSTPNVRSHRNLPPPLGNTAAGVRYVTTAFNWSVTPNESYVADKPAAVRLNPCPMGVSGKDKDLYGFTRTCLHDSWIRKATRIRSLSDFYATVKKCWVERCEREMIIAREKSTPKIANHLWDGEFVTS